MNELMDKIRVLIEARDSARDKWVTARAEYEKLDADLLALLNGLQVSSATGVEQSDPIQNESPIVSKTPKKRPRELVIDYVISLRGSETTPKKVAEATGVKASYVRMILGQNKGKGKIERVRGGHYRAVGPTA